MTNATQSSVPLWRECELRWAEWLLAKDYHLEPLADAQGNVGATQAPMLQTRDGLRRAPDILTVSPDGVLEYWEVKFRTRPDFDAATGAPCYWVADDAFADYLIVADRAPFWIVLYEAPNALHSGRWLRASAHAIKAGGRRERRYGRGGEPLGAWVWPVELMSIVDGPEVRPPDATEPLVVDEGDQDWVSNDELVDAVARRWTLRERQDVGYADRLVDEDALLSLQATCLRLGIGASPQYSATRVGELADEDLSATLSLIEHGIRVFWLPPSEPDLPADPRVSAWLAARLLEVSVAGVQKPATGWVIDGRRDQAAPDVQQALVDADRDGAFNLEQYKVVHADPGANVAVLAGAGTGKTETMTERMMFLLATSVSRGRPGEQHAGLLRPRDLVFVTFTKQAAAEMRSRLDGTLLRRQRLCARPALPFRQWASELPQARVSTLHSFAQDLIGQWGAHVGIPNNLAQRSFKVELRRIIRSALSPRLTGLYASWQAGWGPSPAEHEWAEHVDRLWQTLENRAPLMAIYGDHAPNVVLAGVNDSPHAAVCDVVNRALTRVADDFAELCRREDAIPLSQLIPVALHVLANLPAGGLPDIRHVFIDEFQDTDAQQIALMTHLMRAASCRVFIVGDVKQGIYRFRGAAGDAFTQVSRDLASISQTIEPYALSKNFRTTPSLMSDLNAVFQAWHTEGVLDYPQPLRAMRPNPVVTSRLQTVDVPWMNFRQIEPWCAEAAADRVAQWKSNDPDAGIGILCRDNRQALLMRQVLGDRGIDCVTYTGGEFYRTRAVAEARCLLEAVTDPTNNAALLELMQTCWGPGLAANGLPAPALELTESEASEWEGEKIELADWATRLAEFDGERFDLSDLEPLRSRLRLLGGLARRTSSLNVLTSLLAGLQPARAAIGQGTPSDAQRYSRCLTHLITILVDTFEGGSATLPSMLEWLRLKIATDTSEDEPVDPELVQGDRVCVALTVHKAKGLQYARVLIPFTQGRFLRDVSAGHTKAAVVDQGSEVRLLWQWLPTAGGSSLLRNTRGDDPALALDQAETLAEEARLLYVAMTRARDELIVMRGAPARAGEPPNRWTDLIRMWRP